MSRPKCSTFGVIAALALLVMLVGLGLPARAQTEQSIVVLVNDDPITLYDIEQRQRFLAVTTQEKPSPALKKKAIDMLIEERLQLQEGKKLGITPDDANVTKVIAGMAESNRMDVQGLTNALGQMGVNIRTLRDRIKAQVVWQEIVRKKFRRDVIIGDAEVDKVLTGGDSDAEEKTTLQLRQVKYQLPGSADQAAIAKQLAEFEAVRAKVQSCAKVGTLTQGIKGMTVKTLQDQLPSSLSQPTRVLVMNAKIGQMTPPTITGSAIEAYAVCGKRATKGDPQQREQAESKLMEEELGIRAEGLLRDMRQDAFIEYR
ncbi:MAG: SurA N-terminal domain-containing protein [Methyloceanibacter sp.]